MADVDSVCLPPQSDDLLRFAAAEIGSVVRSIWPEGSRVAGLVPSVTNVVVRIEVEGSQGAFAKYGFLGMSLCRSGGAALGPGRGAEPVS